MRGKSLQVHLSTADLVMVGRMRMVLSASGFLTALIDPESVHKLAPLSEFVFLSYFIYSVTFHLSTLNQKLSLRKWAAWMDVLWFALIVSFTGGANSLFFPLFFFAILSASFQAGFEEGARITLFSSVLFALTALVAPTEVEIARLMLRTTIVVAFGYMIAYWGEAAVEQQRRLELLREVSRLANPRFGVDQTITSVLEKTSAFFHGGSCILIMRNNDVNWSLRSAGNGNATRSAEAEIFDPAMTPPLMPFSPTQFVLYNRPLWSFLPWTSACLAFDSERARWDRLPRHLCGSVAELLDARSFISVPLSLRNGVGRIYMISRNKGFRKADVYFLSQIESQAFPVIESIDLLDRIASEAAQNERKKISLDLHDSAIQPYIGLKHGLHALRNQAATDNPLNPALDKLVEITTQVISDLRRFAGSFESGPVQSDPVFVAALRRQVTQLKEFYGIDISLDFEGRLNLNDRLASEVFQIVNEGLSNIRKHTSAQRGSIRFQGEREWLKIQIENESHGAQLLSFSPRSIMERTAALGGMAHVQRGLGGGTAIHIEIPF